MTNIKIKQENQEQMYFLKFFLCTLCLDHVCNVVFTTLNANLHRWCHFFFFTDFDSGPKYRSYACKFLTHCRVESHNRVFSQHSELSRTEIITWKGCK